MSKINKGWLLVVIFTAAFWTCLVLALLAVAK